MNLHDKPIANPLVVLRQEFDDWAVLFDPDTSHAFGINPVGVFIWQRLDGRHTLADIVRELGESCDGVPADVEEHVREFVADLLKQGLAGYEHPSP